jgi:hypothetical protein
VQFLTAFDILNRAQRYVKNLFFLYPSFRKKQVQELFAAVQLDNIRLPKFRSRPGTGPACVAENAMTLVLANNTLELLDVLLVDCQYSKPGPLGLVRVQRLCQLNDP